MNYNISNNFNSVQFSPFMPQNKMNGSQVILLCTILFYISHFNSFKAEFSSLLVTMET